MVAALIMGAAIRPRPVFVKEPIVSRTRAAFFMPLRRPGLDQRTGVRYGPGSAAHREDRAALRPGHESRQITGFHGAGTSR